MKFQKDNDDDGSENIEDSISSNDNNSSASNNNILFNIDIKLSDTKSVKLYINENDDIDERIKNFCQEYKLKPQISLMIKKIVENKLNQELSALKNSSTASSSKFITNNDNSKNNINKKGIFQSLNNECYSFQDKRNENENILQEIEPKDNLRKKYNNKNQQIDKVPLIKNKKMYNKSTNEAMNNNNNLKKYKTNTAKNKLNINNRCDYIKIAKNNKDNYRAKKINIIEVRNKELIKKRPNSTGINSNIKRKEYGGVRLYTNYMNSSPIRNLVLQNKYKEKDKKYFKFSPEINKNSQKICEKNRHLLAKKKVEDRLIDYGNKLNQKLLTEKTNILLKDIQNNTFTPQIDNFSRYIADNMKSDRINKLMKVNDILVANNSKKKNNNSKNKKTINLNVPFEKRNKSQSRNKSKDEISTFVSFGDNNNNNIIISKKYKESYLLTDNNTSIYDPSKNIFDCLYLESKLDKMKKENEINKQLKDRYTFRPNISNLAKELKKENKETQKQFVERLSSLPKMQKKDIRREENEKNSFRPKITRGPLSGKSREINENLNGFYDKRITIQKETLENDEIKNNKEKKKYYMKKSSEVIMKMKYDKYKALFELLDSDKDGLISYNKINLNGINNNILIVIKPILGELYETKKTFDLNTFCDKIQNLFNEQNIKDIKDITNLP